MRWRSPISTSLVAGQSIAESNQRFSDTLFDGATGAASTVGDAAGLIVSAPTSVIDPDACSDYGERIGSFGGGLFGR